LRDVGLVFNDEAQRVAGAGDLALRSTPALSRSSAFILARVDMAACVSIIRR